MANRDFLNWFAGFLAGEGCFTACKYSYVGRFEHITPMLVIQLRADDCDVLREIQRELGMGRLYVRQSPYDKLRNNHPVARWELTRLAHCQLLIGLLRDIPLRGKKEADFRIWAELVDARVAHRGRGVQLELAKRLSGVKEYEAREEEVSKVEGRQLRLVV